MNSKLKLDLDTKINFNEKLIVGKIGNNSINKNLLRFKDLKQNNSYFCKKTGKYILLKHSSNKENINDEITNKSKKFDDSFTHSDLKHLNIKNKSIQKQLEKIKEEKSSPYKVKRIPIIKEKEKIKSNLKNIDNKIHRIENRIYHKDYELLKKNKNNFSPLKLANKNKINKLEKIKEEKNECRIRIKNIKENKLKLLESRNEFYEYYADAYIKPFNLCMPINYYSTVKSGNYRVKPMKNNASTNVNYMTFSNDNDTRKNNNAIIESNDKEGKMIKLKLNEDMMKKFNHSKTVNLSNDHEKNNSIEKNSSNKYLKNKNFFSISEDENEIGLDNNHNNALNDKDSKVKYKISNKLLTSVNSSLNTSVTGSIDGEKDKFIENILEKR